MRRFLSCALAALIAVPVMADGDRSSLPNRLKSAETRLDSAESRLDSAESTTDDGTAFVAFMRAEFAGTAPNGDFGGVALSGGTGTTAPTAEAGYPGTLAQRGHATNANSGHVWATGQTGILVAGQWVEITWKPVILTNIVGYYGFGNTFSAAIPASGAAFRLTAGVLHGANIDASTPTVTATSYTPTLNTWYKLRVEVLTASVRYTVKSAAGATLWTEDVAGIPTAATCIEAATWATTTPGAVDVNVLDLILAKIRP